MALRKGPEGWDFDRHPLVVGDVIVHWYDAPSSSDRQVTGAPMSSERHVITAEMLSGEDDTLESLRQMAVLRKHNTRLALERKKPTA